MNRIFLPLIIGLVISLTDAVAQQNKSKEQDYATVTWIEKNGQQYKLMMNHSEQIDLDSNTLVWQNPITIYSSENAINSSNLTTLSSGQQFLFWAEYNKNGLSTLRSMTRDNKLGEWSEPITFFNQGTENIGISTLRHDSKLWVFWASTSEQLPDIVYKEYSAGKWQPIKNLHPKNSAPDLHPTAHFNTDNELIVNWLSYSFLQSSYTTAEKKIDDGFDIPSEIDTISIDEVKRPVFLPYNQSITIRFPRNLRNQSRVLLPTPNSF